MKVVLTIEDTDLAGQYRKQSFIAEQENGKFALGLVAQVTQAAVAVRNHEVIALKNLINSITPLFPILRDILLAQKVQKEGVE